MSLLNTPFWQDLGGSPRTGVHPPTLVVRSGHLTPQRYGEIQQIYVRFSLAKLTAVGDFFVFNRVLSDGTRVRLESMQGKDRVFVWASDAPAEDDGANAQGWRAIPSASIWGGSGWVRHKTTGVLRSVDAATPITTPGYEGTDPHVLISAKNGSITLNSKHVAGEWYWTDHKKQRLLFAKDGAYLHQRLVNLHFDGAKVEGRVNGGGIAGGWVLLVLGTKLYAVRKRAVLSAAGKPVKGLFVGDLPEWKITEGIRPVWRFSPDGLKAVAVEGLGNVDLEGSPADVQKYLNSSGTTTGTQYIHRLQLTAAASVEPPFSLEVTKEVRTNSGLKIQPLYEFTPNKVGEDFKFLDWYATAYAKFNYVFPFGFTTRTFSWERFGESTRIRPDEYEELEQALHDFRIPTPFPIPSSDMAGAILHPSPGMREYVMEPPPPSPTPPTSNDPQVFRIKYLASPGDAEYTFTGSLGTIGTASAQTTSVLAGPNKNEWAAQFQGPNLYVLQPPNFDRGEWWGPPPSAGHADFVRYVPDIGGQERASLRALSAGFVGRFSDTYPVLADHARPIGEVMRACEDLVAYYNSQTLPQDLATVADSIAEAQAYVDGLGSPSTYNEMNETHLEPVRLSALPSSVIHYTEDGAAVLGLSPTVGELDPLREQPDTAFWGRFYSSVSITVRLSPAYDLYKTFDYTAATSWVFSGRYIVDMDYGPDGKERELALVGDETRAVRYSVALRAVDVYAGARPNEADAQRRLSGACAYTLQLDGDVVAERRVTASDSYSGFLWTEQPMDWSGFRSATWDDIWGERNFYDLYLGLRRGNAEGTGQIANTECAGSMACRVSDQSFELLDFDVRFKHVLLAQTTQTLTRTTQTTAIDAVRNRATLHMALWDNGELRTLGEQVETTSRQWWTGSVPMFQNVLYGQAQLTRPAVYLSGMQPPSFRFGGIGGTPRRTTADEYDDRVGKLVVPLISGYEGSATHFSITMGVLPAYEALVRAGYADARLHANLTDIGTALTYGRVLSYGADVWLVVVNRDRLPLASFSVARTKNANAPSAAKRLHQLLPFLQTVAGTNGALALPGYVT